MIDSSEGLLKTLSIFFPFMIGPAYIISVNALTISLDVPTANSNIWIQPKGTGKSFFLQKLAGSNPDYVILLPDKLFESAILEFPKDWFEDKVWVHDDMIVAFHGLTTKQRQQLTGFFVEFLSKGKYARIEKRNKLIVEGRISCIFPIAIENYSKYRRELYDQTLVPERLIPITHKVNIDKLYEVVDRSIEAPLRNISIKLPFTKDKVKVTIPESLKRYTKQFATTLSISTGISITRAVMYVSNWLKSHALLNGRYEVSDSDISVFRLLAPLHAIGRDTARGEIYLYLAKKYLESGEINMKDVYQKFSVKYSPRTVRRLLKEMVERFGWTFSL